MTASPFPFCVASNSLPRLVQVLDMSPARQVEESRRRSDGPAEMFCLKDACFHHAVDPWAPCLSNQRIRFRLCGSELLCLPWGLLNGNPG